MDLAQNTTLTDRSKVVATLEGNHSDEDNQIFYISLYVAITNSRLSYCKKHDTNNNKLAAWRDLVNYCYISINDEIRNLEHWKRN